MCDFKSQTRMLKIHVSFYIFCREIAEVDAMLAEERAKRIRKKARRRAVKEHPYKYLLCVDFEATCWDIPTFNKRKVQEIIEFPAVLINLETGEIEKEFQRYVRPTELSELSDYCINLTGISQETVNNGALIQDVLDEFRKWVKEVVKEKDLILPKMKKSNLDGNCALVTWTNWDFLIQLRNECNRKQLRKPSFFNNWIDLKEIYMERFPRKEQFSFSEALANSGLEFVGRPHSGLDDARMTALLAHKLHKEGAFLRITKDMNHYSKINRPF